MADIMERSMTRYIKWIIVLLSVLTFGAAMSGVHQMQTAEGVGLYWSTIFGTERLLFDILVDLLAGLALFLMVFLPCFILKYRSVSAFFRLLVGFLAFMPRLSMSYLIHLFDAGGRGADPELVLSVISTVLPFTCLLLAGVSCAEKPWKKWYGVMGAAALVLGTWALWETQGPGFLMVYALLLVCFDAWERLLEIYSGLRYLGWILFGGIGLRALYCILMLRSVY